MAKAALKWSNTDLAERTGLHKNTLNKAENGQARPATLALLKAIFENEGLTFSPADSQRGECVSVSLDGST